jgi:hypothetical protein
MEREDPAAAPPPAETPAGGFTASAPARRRGSFECGLAWLGCAFTLWRRRPALWLAMSALYLVVALALKRLPFLGHFLLILLSPLALAGALGVARTLKADAEPLPAEPAEPAAGWRPLFDTTLRRPARALLAPLSDGRQVLTLILTGIVALGLAVVVALFELVLTGGSMIAGLSSAKFTLSQPLTLGHALALGAVAVLYLALAMALFYLVPLALYGSRHVIAAAIESFRACTAHAGALAVFAAPFLALHTGILVAFDHHPALGYALVFTLGLAALPAFVAGLYCSYQALFENTAPPPLD